ncbi:phosphatase domain-containing protein [Ornithinimicrobium pratense]|uniref:Phosphatidate phosphatase APP1 catalytic domain-containing protein n=1 Tax=Ornithinimicrobium pratense TaxID=2593973 RepID=A0A5J6V3Q1_9MICO|nr:phosphatase domain-containing protein [Ornithinimicrobium pratense]QFG68345.1 hypothetical protein FY030_06120 [Ornithinimicrobium pratense]
MRAIAAQISHLSRGILTRPRDGRRILEMLQEAPKGSLDEIIATVDLPTVQASMRRTAFGHRPQVVDLLLRERIEELSLESVAEVIGAMHKGRTSRHAQEAIVEALTARTGQEFDTLKNLLNSTGDHHDLEHLVFEDLDEDLGERLLEHIAEQAGDNHGSDLRVLSDIDDTVKCVIHDRRYPKGTIYPGVVSLLTKLDKGAAAEPNRPGDLTFVTARPGGPQGLIEQYTRGKLSYLGLPPHSVMGGSFLNLHTRNAIAERKLQNMDRDRRLFPEARMVFVGDSGQADGDVGAQMHERDPDHIVGTLLHNVTELDEARRQEWANKGVHVFDTYAGAAAHAVRLGLIRVDQAREVAEDVRVGLRVLHLTPDQRSRLQDDLAADEEQIEVLAAGARS